MDDAAFDSGADSFADPLASASKASTIGVGLNWYLNQNTRIMINWIHSHIQGEGSMQSLSFRFAIDF